MTIFQQHGLRDGARLGHLGLQQLCCRGAEQILAAGMFGGKRIDRGGDPRGIETFVSLRPGLCHDAVHDLTRYRTARTLSRDIPWGITADPCWIPPALGKAVLAARAQSIRIFSLTRPLN